VIFSFLAMPRANRYLQAGCLYHLTHRCHDRRFLLRFGTVRTEYRKRLRRALRQYGVSLLACCITSNHTHLLAESPDETALSRMMQKLEGEFAEWYNLRQHRSGAFWSDRYHCTLVDGGAYAWNCMKYIDLNMVRARVVTHPSEWKWCGYDELFRLRPRYRLVDLKNVLRWQDGVSREEFLQAYRGAIEESIRRGDLERQGVWTESIAVVSEAFVGGYRSESGIESDWRRARSPKESGLSGKGRFLTQRIDNSQIPEVGVLLSLLNQGSTGS